MEPTLDKLVEFMKDEEGAVEEYNKYGFYELAEDENRHLEFIKRQIEAKMKQKLTAEGLL